MYYLRSKAAVDPIKFTLNREHQRVRHGNEKEGAFAKTQLPTHAAKAPTVPVAAVATPVPHSVGKTATAQAAASIPTTEVKEKPAAPAPAGKKRNTFGKKRNTFGKKVSGVTATEVPAVTTITADQLDGKACRLDDPDCLSCGA